MGCSIWSHADALNSASNPHRMVLEDRWSMTDSPWELAIVVLLASFAFLGGWHVIAPFLG
jgi:hypothetical protein